jgi:hypothetical protein
MTAPPVLESTRRPAGRPSLPSSPTHPRREKIHRPGGGTGRSLPAACLALAAALLLLGTVACALTTPLPALAPVEASPPAVVLISVDGLRPDAITAADAPVMTRLMEHGAWARSARTVLPSQTVPSHVSMLTGVDVPVHGIDWNVDRTADYGPVRVPVAPEILRHAGCSTAAVVAKTKLRHLERPGAFDRFRVPPRTLGVKAEPVVEEAVRVMRFDRPHLLFVHLADTDIAGHAFGWGSRPYRLAVRRADAAVGRIRDEAVRRYGDRVILVVTSDHGGTGRGHAAGEERDVHIPWIAWGSGVVPGPFEDPVTTYDTAATLLWLFGVEVPAAWDGAAVRAAFGQEGATSGSGARAYRCG